jgi:hypothetical protein
VTSLKEGLKSNDPVKKKEAVESMHKAYEGLNSVFK